MPTRDSLDPPDALPRFLVHHAERDMGHARGGAAAAPRVAKSRAKAGVLLAAATATGVAVLTMVNPAGLFAYLPASLLDHVAPVSTPTIQAAADPPASVLSTADTQAQPAAATTTEVPDRSDVAVATPAGKDATEESDASPDALFRQFQAWAARQDDRGEIQEAKPQTASPIVQEVPVPAADSAHRPDRPLVQKRRQVRGINNARAEIRKQVSPKQVRRAPNARAERPAQDAQAQEQSGQNAQASSFLPMFGSRN